MHGHVDPTRPIEPQVAEWIAELAHVLPAQAPIRDFVHHNTLHGLEHWPFMAALAAAETRTGAQAWWPETRFQAEFAAGRITPADIDEALDDLGWPAVDQGLAEGLPPTLTGRAVWRACLLAAEPRPSATRLAWLSREGRGLSARTAAWWQQLCPTSPPGASDWTADAQARWATWCDRLGQDWTLGELLEALSGESVLESVRDHLRPAVAAHLDLGVAPWRPPEQPAGLYASWRAGAGRDMGWEIASLPHVRDDIRHLPDAPMALLLEELPRVMPDMSRWPGYLTRLAMTWPGWAGMVLWRDQHPGVGPAGVQVAMLDYLAISLFLERQLAEDLIRRLTGAPLSVDELQAHYALESAEFVVREARHRSDLSETLRDRIERRLSASRAGLAVDDWAPIAAEIAALPRPVPERALDDAWRLAQVMVALDVPATAWLDWTDDARDALQAAVHRFDAVHRRHVWLMAYEGHYRNTVLSALAAQQVRPLSTRMVSAQVICCMDDREEGTRRHLEEIAPDIETYGAAGFFGVAMAWQGLDDATPTALCPVVVQPRHLIREWPQTGAEALAERRAKRRARRLRWREHWLQATRSRPLTGLLATLIGSGGALAALLGSQWAPAWYGAARARRQARFDGRVPTQLAVSAADAAASPIDGLQAGFSDAEQVDRVFTFLQTLGLTTRFAPLVLMLGHGSSSQNNPHASAYDCGACSGRHGGPNARVFATLANRPVVRAGLAARGLVIPDTTWFVAAEHDTGDDSVHWYDLAQVPDAWQGALDTLIRQVAEACRAHAVERCRRLASAPRLPSPWQARRHVAGRVQDPSQARPELGHATNAAAYIGRRARTRGIFLDRRVFLISYDPTHDLDGATIESILLAAGPVGAGIALEYYFSTVDNAVFGCGSKVTHNLTGQFGVLEGTASDLRTGLPWQMVEIHEPMRLLVVVEQTPAILSAVLARQPALQGLVGNQWIQLVAHTPERGELARYCPRRGWVPWQGDTVLPQVRASVDWFAGQSGPLPPARLLGTAP